MLGDNLSSNLSVEVMEKCRDNNIELDCLPANSTEKM